MPLEQKVYEWARDNAPKWVLDLLADARTRDAQVLKLARMFNIT